MSITVGQILALWQKQIAMHIMCIIDLNLYCNFNCSFTLEFAEKNVDLFSRFIPNLVGHANSLDQEINETEALQENLRNQEEFLR
jgi:hypothetical protein